MVFSEYLDFPLCVLCLNSMEERRKQEFTIFFVCSGSCAGQRGLYSNYLLITSIILHCKFGPGQYQI
jgi:hypothetical protein